MGQYCEIADAYTNCTDNCDRCLEEEKKRLELKEQEEKKNET